jgi:hypothetical protein
LSDSFSSSLLDAQFEGGDDDYRQLKDMHLEGGGTELQETEAAMAPATQAHKEEDAAHADFRRKFAAAVVGSAEFGALPRGSDAGKGHSLKYAAPSAGRVDEMEVTDFKELLIFEPKGSVAYFQAIWHNSFEIIFVLITIGLQLLMPSGYSVCMWLASHTLLISASYRPVARIKWGSVFACINLLLCVFILARKLSFMSGGDGSSSFTCSSNHAAGHNDAHPTQHPHDSICHFTGDFFPQPTAAADPAT